MTQRLLIIIGLLCLFSVAYAQGDIDPRILLIDESELFTDNAEIVRRYVIVHTLDETQTIHVYNTEPPGWLVFDYPPDVSTLTGGFSYIHDNDVLLYSLQSPLSDKYLLLNTETGEFTEPEERCGSREPLLGSGAYEEFWRYDGSGFCDVFSLENYPLDDATIEILNADNQPYHCLRQPSQARFSPERDQFVFTACSDENFVLYHYALDDQSVEELFSIEGAESIQIIDWQDNDNVVITTEVDERNANDFSEPAGSKVHRLNTQTGETVLIGFSPELSVVLDGEINRWTYNGADYVMLFGVEQENFYVNAYDMATGIINKLLDISCDDLPLSCTDSLYLLSVHPDLAYVTISNGDDEHYMMSANTDKVIYEMPDANYHEHLWVNDTTYFWYEDVPYEDLNASRLLNITTVEAGMVVSETTHDAEAYSVDGTSIYNIIQSEQNWSIVAESLDTGDSVVLMTIDGDNPIHSTTRIEVYIIYWDNSLSIGIRDLDRYELLGIWLVRPIFE